MGVGDGIQKTLVVTRDSLEKKDAGNKLYLGLHFSWRSAHASQTWHLRAFWN